ncbi:hypothetical protein HPP92_009225 [Vanilla planifolia]|uniref:Uncharacterized protein n=1 Tax=Vanilla planifolia TaxID=51239 RepID=A0A835V6B1_VANPL|nr:hypothetical protein HPP92_009429 [Vanilla planifolia]KAG0487130.1 hypothetical protein HPP92_009225 [Vanilla planifolia]
MNGLFILQTWTLYEQGELERIIDLTMWSDLDTKEASRFLKVGLLCTQDMAKLRPPMTAVVKMLSGEIDVESMNITKPGLVSDFMVMKVPKMKNNILTMSSLSSVSSNEGSSGNTTYGSMTFTAINDRE